jgi:hypothetical protein
MDWNRVEGNWKQVKGKVKEQSHRSQQRCGRLHYVYESSFRRSPVIRILDSRSAKCKWPEQRDHRDHRH